MKIEDEEPTDRRTELFFVGIGIIDAIVVKNINIKEDEDIIFVFF